MVLISLSSCSKEEFADLSEPQGKYIYYLDGQPVSENNPGLRTVSAIYLDPSAKTISCFSTDECFDIFVSNSQNLQLKGKWAVTKVIRKEVKDKNITHPLSSDEFFELIPKDLKTQYNISKGEHGEVIPKFLGFIQLFDKTHSGVGVGCSRVFWGWCVNLTNVGFCGGGNWNDKAGHVHQWFGVHGLFEHINCSGQSFWVGGVGGNTPLEPPHLVFGQNWDNRISSIL